MPPFKASEEDVRLLVTALLTLLAALCHAVITHFRGHKQDRSKPRMTVNRLYTNPLSIAEVDAEHFDEAKTSIDFASYTLTEPTTIAALVRAAARGIQIRLYLDRTELEASAHHDATGMRLPFHDLFSHGSAVVKVKRSSILMHLKCYCVDNTTVRTGSANHSPLGLCSQDNEAAWDNDTAQVALFNAKFESMWTRPDNLTVAQAITVNHAERQAFHRSSENVLVSN